ncbi:MAG: hypothetical protein QM487_02820 [Candidatus Marithrix sp.]
MSLTVLFNMIAIITLVLAVSISIFGYFSSTQDTGTTGTIGAPTCLEITDISSLVQIPSNQPHCFQQGRETSLFYIGTLNQNFDYVVAPYGSSPLDVCVSFCKSYSNGVCEGDNFAGKTAQENFDACITQLTPTDCVPPLPIAAQGTILYYALAPTSLICETR